MSRYPLHNAKLIEPEAGWFPALLVQAQTPVGSIQFLNVHLRPPLPDSGPPNLSALYKTPPVRLKEIQQFLAEVDLEKPAVVLGDFNENEKSTAMSWLINQGFTDSLSAYDADSPTWTWQTAAFVTLEARFDHILYSRHLYCTQAAVADFKASDHMPVVAVLIAGGSE